MVHNITLSTTMLPPTYQETRRLALSKLNQFDQHSHGQLFWNFRTELEDKWDYQRAVQLGWLPGVYDGGAVREIAAACGATSAPSDSTAGGDGDSTAGGDGTAESDSVGGAPAAASKTGVVPESPPLPLSLPLSLWSVLGGTGWSVLVLLAGLLLLFAGRKYWSCCVCVSPNRVMYTQIPSSEIKAAQAAEAAASVELGRSGGYQ